ncbi:MAG: glycosyltransferase involved in cell wall biosynthesis [Saprospiraceae bacterium]|jgi:glycosyltransferase involved in cell wall biosynthesis
MNKSGEKPTIALVSNTSWSLYNFRLGLIKKLLKEGYRVLAIAPKDKYTGLLIDNGCDFESIELDNYGSNPIRDFKSFLTFRKIYRRQKIDFIFHYTIKPNIYGSLAAFTRSIPSIAVVTGLGHLFTKISWKTTIAKILYKIAFLKVLQVWFLNESDASIFSQIGLVPESKIKYLPSEGVNTQHFQQYAYGILSNSTFKFMLASRLIIEKGIREYVEAARLVRNEGFNVEFQLLGFIESANPQGISLEKVKQWEAEGLIRYLGHTDDIRPYLKKIDCLVLPTYYREGVPRILMEGASMQIPLIATDNIGCRQVVEDSVNGFLCQRKNPTDLARCMKQMMILNTEERAHFGLLGRRRVYTLYHESIIINKYLRTLRHYFNVNKKTPLSVKPILEKNELKY